MRAATMSGLAAVLALIAGCGSDGSFDTATEKQLGDYQVVDLDTGSAAWRAQAPDVAGDPQMSGRFLVLRRMPGQQGAQIGADTAEPFATDDEKPATFAAVRSCFIAATECTAAQWAHLRGVAEPSAGGSMPAVELSRDEVLTALDAFAKRTGVALDLPTHVEWEAAARWGHAGELPFDPAQPTARESQARVRETVTGDGAGPVAGSRQPDPLGLYDMHGNVWELVRDLDGRGQAAARGGSWADPVRAARASNRLVVPSDAGHTLIGFRLVLRP